MLAQNCWERHANGDSRRVAHWGRRHCDLLPAISIARRISVSMLAASSSSLSSRRAASARLCPSFQSSLPSLNSRCRQATRQPYPVRQAVRRSCPASAQAAACRLASAPQSRCAIMRVISATERKVTSWFSRRCQRPARARRHHPGCRLKDLAHVSLVLELGPCRHRWGPNTHRWVSVAGHQGHQVC